MTAGPLFLAEGGAWPTAITGVPRSRAALIALSGRAKRHLARSLHEFGSDGTLRVPWGIAGYVLIRGQPAFIVPKCFEREDPKSVWARAAPGFLKQCRNLPGSSVWVSGIGGFQVTHELLGWWADYYSMVLWRALRQYPVLRYEDRHARLGYVRGRIIWTKQLGESAAGGTGVWCSFRAYQSDNDVNRLLYWAAQRFLRTAASWSTRVRLNRCIEAFEGVQNIEPDRRVVARLRLAPAMVVYRDPFAVARTLFEGRYPALGPGAAPAFGFVINMVKAFEAFVDGLVFRVVASANRRGERWSYESQSQRALAFEVATDSPRYYTRPDNTITTAKSVSRVGIVIDAKYKGIAADPEKYPRPVSSDIYQVLAACIARGWRAAIVISPALLRPGVAGHWAIRQGSERSAEVHIVHWQADLAATGADSNSQESELLDLVSSLLSA